MNKVDGIQKMPADELKKKREIILGMLGEDFDAPKTLNNKMDGILPSPKIKATSVSPELVAAAEKRHAAEQRQEWQEEMRQNALAGKDVLAEIAVNKKINQVAPDVAVKEKPEKKITKKAPVKKTPISTRKKIKSDETIVKKLSYAKRRFFAGIDHGKKSILLFVARLKIALKRFVFVSMSAILAFSILYFSLFLFIVNSKIDNGFFRFFGRLLPVPALIVDNHIINFYDYIDQKNKFGGDSDEMRLELIENVLSDNFHQKYQNNEAAASEVINIASLNRMRKIKSQIESGADFNEIAGKYGDKRESMYLGAEDFAKLEYGSRINSLNEGEMSGIIFSQDGYYLFKCYKKDSYGMNVSYIFVQAKNFEQYVEETAKNIYYVSFVD